MTIGQRLDATGGRPTGFDYLRIGLACAVIIVHSVGISYVSEIANSIYVRPIIHAGSMLILPMFFSLSGFLVSGSLERSKTLFGFLGLRAIRIYPALAVEVLLSALILGAFFTTLPLNSYFTNPVFFRYLVNVTGHISFYLPGVFANNPDPNLVNRQLWTVPYELYCYLAISLISIAGIFSRSRIFLCAVIFTQIILFARRVDYSGTLFFTDEYMGHVSGPQLVIAFLSGVLMYKFRRALPYSNYFTVISGVASFALFSFPVTSYIGVFVAAYFTVALGLTNFRKHGFLKGADYSYGVYLYGWPVQQALVATGDWARNAVVNSISSLALCFLIAAASWHFVEAPATRLRGPLKRLEAKWLTLLRPIAPMVHILHPGSKKG